MGTLDDRLEYRVEVGQLAARLADLERRISSTERSAQAAHTSIENGAMSVYDGAGSLRGQVGIQSDGTAGVVAVNGPQPPTPTVPTVVPIVGGLDVAWDGLFVDALAAPLDFTRVEVHAFPGAGFTPSPATLRSTIESPQGGHATVTLGQGIWWVLLQARNTSGTAGLPSEEKQGSPMAHLSGPIDGLQTIGDPAGPHAELGTNSAGQSGIRLYAADGSTVLIDLDVLAGAGRFTGSIEASTIVGGTITGDVGVAGRLVAGDPAGKRTQLDAAGLSGYDETGQKTTALSQDGADFLTLTAAGQPKASISSTGVGSFAGMYADSIVYQGNEIGDIFDRTTLGMVGYGYITTSSATTKTIIGLMELSFDVRKSHVYIIETGPVSVVSDVGGGWARLNLHYTNDGSAPTVNSPIICGADAICTEAYNRQDTPVLRRVWQPGADYTMRVLLSIQNQNCPAIHAYADPAAFPIQMWVLDGGVSAPNLAVPSTGDGSVPAVKQYERTYGAVWSGTYDKNGAYILQDGNQLNQGHTGGNGSATNGVQDALFYTNQGWCGFPYAQIAADLAGSTVVGAYLYLHADYWADPAGGQANVSYHNVAAKPQSIVGQAVSNTVVSSAAWPAPAGRWVSLYNIRNLWRDGGARGIVLSATAANPTQAGRFRGFGALGPPTLKLVYTR